ncbi:MAG: flagellar basal body P-ring formation chaperone FlgA [Planctomycetaceae bacterium]|jgi:flagella basal body P-ring formation protein FlgA|nr:flagellar basal body P-ring formation chaperone FlgA [Planctomycetaceae bacterium]
MLKQQRYLLFPNFLFFVFLFAVFVANTNSRFTEQLFGAEIRLRSEPVRCSRNLVTLEDVAEIIPSANEQLQQIDRLRQAVLFTVPERGERRTVERIELRDLLSGIGFSSMQHQLTGAARIVVMNESIGSNNGSAIVPASYTYQKNATNLTPPITHAVNPLRKESVTPQLIKTLEQQIADAIVVYLNYCISKETGTPANDAWKVTVKLTQDQARLLATSGQIEEIFGNVLDVWNPAANRQRFGVRMQGLDPTTQQNIIVTVDAVIELPQQVVVLRRSLPKGYIINESDVMLRRMENLKDENFFVDISEVVGRETTGAVRERSVLTQSMIKKPAWVRKGDIVTVRLLNNGISVRTEGVAQSNGTQGDTIPIETIRPNNGKRNSTNNKTETSTFLARVCDPKTVEVFASGVIVRE